MYILNVMLYVINSRTMVMPLYISFFLCIVAVVAVVVGADIVCISLRAICIFVKDIFAVKLF